MTEQKGLLDIIEENAKSPSGELREALALLRCEEHGTEYFKLRANTTRKANKECEELLDIIEEKLADIGTLMGRPLSLFEKVEAIRDNYVTVSREQAGAWYSRRQRQRGQEGAK